MLPRLKEYAQLKPRHAGAADARLSPHGKFLLEPLEPRVLLSADSILGEVYRSLLDDEARAEGAEFAVIVQEIDAATSAEISAADGNGFGSAQEQIAPSVAWPEGWQTDPGEQLAEEAEALPAAAQETSESEDLQAGLIAAAAIATSTPQNQPAGEDSSAVAGDEQDANSGIIPGTHLPRGPPANDQPSAAVIADESLADNELSLSDSPQGDEGGLCGVESVLIPETFEDSQARAPPESVTPILAEALRLWTATGLTQDQADRLAGIEVRFADLPGAQLGW
ncbi:MAG TPA: LEPR-XLL domain-containing protein, partial [Burkholderiales bacterium]|nr:LEPR-XLL domain-containing protein [Burkholderiales bacterium]